jgi:hypothetical protein
MCSDCLVVREEDPSIFEVLNPCKYYQNFIKYIGFDITICSVSTVMTDIF